MDLKVFKNIFIVGLLLFSRNYSQEKILQHNNPKSDEKSTLILLQVVQAIGGADVIQSITTMQTRIHILQKTNFGEVEVTGSFWIRYPDHLRSELTLPGGKVTILFNGFEGKTIVHGQEAVQMDALKIQQYKRNMSRDPVVLLRQYNQWKTLYAGKYNLYGNETEDILLCEGQDQFHLLIDAETMLPAGVMYHENGKVIEESFFDYQCFNGYWIPTRTTTHIDGVFFSETHRLELILNSPISFQWFESE
jgi:hypothetical protein